MTATLTPRFAISGDELQVVTARLGVQSLPVVLNVRPRHDTESALFEAFDRANDALAGRGLIRDGEVASELAALLRGLQRPERELAMRLVTPDGIARITVVRHGTQCISARRVDDEVVLESVEGDAGVSTAARTLLRQLPAAKAADILPVGAPVDAAAEALSDSHDATLLSDRIRALGAEARAALLLGSALAARLAFAEIVYYALDQEVDRISRCPAAVGVFYTKRGRIVSAPSASPSGQLWTTFKPGSDHVIKQAVGQLVELSAERWEEY